MRTLASTQIGAFTAAALFVLCLAPGRAQAIYLNDASGLESKQAVFAAAAKGATSAEKAGLLKQADLDTRAKKELDCKDLEAAAMLATKDMVNRRKPADPGTVLQGSTCFVEVAMTKIPVILTGIGFIDKIIRDRVQTYLTGRCSKSIDFLSGLKNDALQQLNKATGGKASLLQRYSNRAIDSVTTSVENQAKDVVQGLISTPPPAPAAN